jgi:XTP/dITP diphosphohydrolase
MIGCRVLLLATTNEGKLRELKSILSNLEFSLRELSDFPTIKDVPETGKTFLENACLKAAGYARQTRLLTLADDSGLEVDALQGRPGILSARYGSDCASDVERTAKVLDEITSVPEGKRTARFVSVVAIANESAEIINVATGICEGRLTHDVRGTGGFGYDPIFVTRGYDSTFGELPPAIKNQISHRASALRQTHDFLRSLTAQSAGG